MFRLVLITLIFTPAIIFGQNYTSYFTGNTTDITTSPEGGICLMGGATEDDNAMKWFLERADGGDILVLRTSGSDGYNNYLYSELGITVNSVETIVCNNASASTDPYVLQKIQQAEAIWFAGGNQWTYVSFWRNTPFNDALNEAITQRNIVIGGTSAGMAIQGKYYFSAQNGTITSATAMANPFHNAITVDSTAFLDNDILNNVITDTHFDDPDRRGRLVTFLARIYTDYGVYGTAIACDEYTAVCIDTEGIATVYGAYPTFDDNAYFIQSNCELADQSPENITANNPLNWDKQNQALKVYQIKGDNTGTKHFDLNTWATGEGGTWLHWSVENGVFTEEAGTALNCTPLSNDDLNFEEIFDVYPNPATDKITLEFKGDNPSKYQTFLVNHHGQKIKGPITITHILELDINHLSSGVYFLLVQNKDNEISRHKFIKY
ncbi:MAG: T9SS type A sorting domain-containing protein [Bacteroidota bacterium]